MLMPSSHSEAKFARTGELYAYLKLNGTVSEDTAHGRLILQNVNTLYLAPIPSHDLGDTDSNISKHCSDGSSSKKMGEDSSDDHNKKKQPDKVSVLQSELC